MSTMPGVGFSREYLKRDSQVWWRPGRLYRPAYNMQGLYINTNLVSLGTGTSTVQNLNSTTIASLHTGATGNTVCDFIELPYDIDVSKHIYFSVDWCASGTSGSLTPTIKYTPYVVGTTAFITPATALDSVMVAQTTAGVAYTLTRSAEGFIAPNILNDNVEFLGLQFTLTLATLTTVEMLGYTIRYTPKRLYYDGMLHDAKAPTYIGSNKYPAT